jgi:1-acyl-sn-glycerol-3-phosphate acyltransferase
MIPIFGWYLKKIGSISIKRNKVSKENLDFFGDILKLVNSSNRPLIIFPQGTRLLPEDRAPFKKGAGRIYEKLKISCQPIAINSGFTWPKHGLKKIDTTLTISILKLIEPGQDKELFLKNLQNVIYTELDALN